MSTREQRKGEWLDGEATDRLHRAFPALRRGTGRGQRAHTRSSGSTQSSWASWDGEKGRLESTAVLFIELILRRLMSIRLNLSTGAASVPACDDVSHVTGPSAARSRRLSRAETTRPEKLWPAVPFALRSSPDCCRLDYKHLTCLSRPTLLRPCSAVLCSACSPRCPTTRGRP